MVGLSPILGIADTALKLIYNQLNPSEHKLIDQKRKEADDDVKRFKDALLENNWNTVDLYLERLRVGVSIDITPLERASLIGSEVRGNAYTLLGFYARGRCALMMQDIMDIVREKQGDK